MKKILVIGMGAGDPDYMTIQAINALNAADVLFVMDKGAEKQQLAALRREICERFITHRNYRIVEAREPDRDRNPSDYRAAVDEQLREKAAVFERLISDELAADGCGAFLVWGDPSLYDSTIRILQAVLAAGRCVFAFEVIPGITSIQALAAKHKVTLTGIGQSVEITTGRRIAADFPASTDNAVVMLDGQNAYRNFVDQEIEIYWGAYVGMKQEILVSGKLRDVAERIDTLRADARRANGWIMDNYLLRRSG